ncbi:hypothetical protein D3C80_820630 [compost metagenome]
MSITILKNGEAAREGVTALSTSSLVLGLLLIFLAASIILGYVEKSENRLLRVFLNVVIVLVSICCTGLLIHNYR